MCGYGIATVQRRVCRQVMCWQVGMATTFEFWAFPDRARLRLSQIFVPPPHQHGGVGRALLEAVYHTAAERDALDVTVRVLNTTGFQICENDIYLFYQNKLPATTQPPVMAMTRRFLDKHKCSVIIGARICPSILMQSCTSNITVHHCACVRESSLICSDHPADPTRRRSAVPSPRHPQERHRPSACAQVEDPAPQLRKLRDRHDLRRLAALPWLAAHAERVREAPPCRRRHLV